MLEKWHYKGLNLLEALLILNYQIVFEGGKIPISILTKSSLNTPQEQVLKCLN